MPEVASDDEFWAVLDEARALVANDDEGEFNKIIRERAYETMKKHSVSREDDREEDEDDAHLSSTEQDHQEEDDAEEVPTRRSKRKRSCVLSGDESDDDGERGEGNRGGGGVPRRAAGGDGGSGEVDEEASPLPRRLSRRDPPESISGIVGRQRSTGSLPSRRDVVLQLMDLQLRLQREDRGRDSALCTNAILTLQELLQKVEDLRHTV